MDDGVGWRRCLSSFSARSFCTGHVVVLISGMHRSLADSDFCDAQITCWFWILWCLACWFWFLWCTDHLLIPISVLHRSLADSDFCDAQITCWFWFLWCTDHLLILISVMHKSFAGSHFSDAQNTWWFWCLWCTGHMVALISVMPSLLGSHSRSSLFTAKKNQENHQHHIPKCHIHIHLLCAMLLNDVHAHPWSIDSTSTPCTCCCSYPDPLTNGIHTCILLYHVWHSPLLLNDIHTC